MGYCGCTEQKIEQPMKLRAVYDVHCLGGSGFQKSRTCIVSNVRSARLKIEARLWAASHFRTSVNDKVTINIPLVNLVH